MAELRFTADDGLKVAYSTWPEEAPAGELPAVVLHHGFLADARANWVGPGIVDALVSSGRRVVGIDARGHGRPDRPHDPGRYGYERMTAGVSQLADHVGPYGYDLIGYSMGAIVSLSVASNDDRVRRLAVGGIGAGVLAGCGAEGRALMLDAVADPLLTDDPASITDPTAKQLRTFAEAMGNDVAAVAAQARAGTLAQPTAVDRITAPTLVYAGDADTLAVKPERLAGAITDARLEILAGDHLSVLNDPRLAPLLVGHVSESPSCS